MINLLINIFKKKKKKLIMRSYNYNIKMKNNKENLIKFYSLIVKTKMTIFLACQIKKYRVKPFYKRQNKK